MVYVDIVPVAIAHAQALLRSTTGASVVVGDLRHPGDILDNPAIRSALDFDRPIAVIFGAVLHFVLEQAEAEAIVRTVRDAVVPGSNLRMPLSRVAMPCAFCSPKRRIRRSVARGLAHAPECH